MTPWKNVFMMLSSARAGGGFLVGTSLGRAKPVSWFFRRVVFVCLVAGLGACSMEYKRAPLTLVVTEQASVWPDLPSMPRYAYVGSLYTDEAFILKEESKGTGLGRALRWLTGLDSKTKFLELRRPVNGIVDSRGRIVVVDAGHKAVLVFDMEQARLLKWMQNNRGVPFEGPVSIVEASDGTYFVTDAQQGLVIHLGPEGERIGEFGADELLRPTGITRDPVTDTIYVSDTGDHRIKVFNAQGALVNVIGCHGVEPGCFNVPTHLAFAKDKLYVTDTFNFRIQVFDRQGHILRTIGEMGVNIGQLSRPKGVAVGRDGRVYIIEGYYDHMLMFSDEGQFLLSIGGTGFGPGRFYLPAGVWTDEGGRVYVADMFNGRVEIFEEILTPVALQNEENNILQTGDRVRTNE